MRPIYFFWVVFVVSLYWMGYLYQDFLMNLLIAGLLCVASYWLKHFFEKYIKNNFITSFLCVFVLLTFFILPLYFVIHQSIDFLRHLEPHSFQMFIEKLRNFTSNTFVDFPSLNSSLNKVLSNISVDGMMTYALKFSSYIGKYSLNFVMNTGFIVVFLFFFFYYGRKMYDYAIKLLPFQKSESQAVFEEINGVLHIVFLTSIINVLLQGLAFGIAVMWFGYDGFLLGVLYGLASLIPIVGGALLWIPIVGYEIYLGNITGAVFIGIYSLVFISFVIDNLIKPIIITIIKQKILKTPIQISEILIFFSILAGISTFGFWGIVVGPTITAFFIALLRLYQNNFSYKN
ncbi:AI-2E family transporter [Helicobacter cappadocius]|uniref:AI-2E family transporter n=1 Tax=Helicobacter cappadocius TaxID=3063998 RepID=A0AA90PUC3_9HELI|nr:MULTISPECIES: AI-2E family transporter [unclassified Helicobacter]MDO7252827.1 AI-2E family transporter [Helicobacter sp. faydin-H75]MDP2538870.1 AI-2E family transporter [Helicobacter sp. faydin-H76]